MLTFLFGVVSFATAAIYTFVDENGAVHYSNVPNDPRYKLLLGDRPSRGSLSADAYDEYIQRAAQHHEVDPMLIKAVIKAESDFDPYAVSRKGAKGLMQLMPETASDMNVHDPFDPEANIHGGTRYLRKLLAMFDGDLHKSLAAYNAGPETVKRVGRVPQISETRQYIKKVLRYYEALKGGPSSKTRVKVAYE